MKRQLLILWLMLLAGATGIRAAEAYTYFDPSDGSLNFCYDDSKSYWSGRGYSTWYLNSGWNDPGWFTSASKVTNVYFYSEFANYRPTSCFRWFSHMYNLTTFYHIDRLNTSSVTNMYSMFALCKNLTYVDVSGFNTANVTTMERMFEQCPKLTNLNVSGFNTSKVTNMQVMFDECASLTSLNVSNFNTSKVTSMWIMFSGCSSLTSLNLGNFNTSNCIDMHSMFSGCSSLTYLNVSSFNTSKVANMSYMFANCSNLTSLNVSNFTTSSTTTLEGMFKGCSKVTSLTLNFWISSSTAQKSNQMLYGCSALKSLTLKDTGYASDAFYGVGTASSPCTLSYSTTSHPTFSSITPDYVVWNQGYFKNQNMHAFVTLDSSGELQFRYSDWYWYYKNDTNYKTYELNTGTNTPGWKENAGSVTNVVFSSAFANARPTSCYMWFQNMKNITGINNLAYLNTSQVTNMACMFDFCGKLATLDIAHFNTAKVTDMHYMFRDCSALTSINVANFNTSKVNDMDHMFAECTNLTSIDVGSFTTSNTVMSWMFYKCTKLTSLDLSNFTITADGGGKYYSSAMLQECSALKTLTIPSSAAKLSESACYGIGTKSAPCTLIYPSGFTPQKEDSGDGWYQWKRGYFKDDVEEPYAVFSGTTLTFYYDRNRSSRSGTTYGMNTGSDTPGWYDHRNNITKVVFNSSFANARPTSCHGWFEGMAAITSITGLSYLNTSKVTDMASMFLNCTSLANLDLSKFNTANVTDMGDMFYRCTSLTDLNLSKFNTSKVTRMWGMFQRCENLTSVNVSSFNTANVNNMQAMFQDCGKLATLDLSSFNTSKVTDMGMMFDKCEKLTSLDLGNFNTAKVTSMAAMFRECLSLTSLNLSSFNTSLVNDMSEMFASCISLTNIDLSKFNTAKVTNMKNMLDGCTGLTSLDLSKFDFSKLSYSAYMMRNCSGLTILTIPSTAGKLSSNVCTGVGTKTKPCTLVYPSGFTPQKDDSGNGWYQWKKGYFKDGEQPSQFLMGDVNHDGIVDISDVMMAVNHSLGKKLKDFYFEEADTDKDGVVDIVDVMNIVHIMLNGAAPPNPPTPTEHNYVDLGLPSGTLWADCNVGASKPEGYGNFYAWGETKTKDTYSWSNYLYASGSQSTCQDIGTHIAGTKYDVATAEWGSEWVMPTIDQANELLKNTSISLATVNGVPGLRFKGSNGNSIFFPMTGYKYDSNYSSEGTQTYLWTETKDNVTHVDYKALAIYIERSSSSAKANTTPAQRRSGVVVRPVRK